MATQAQRRTWRHSVERALNERERADRYAARQHEIRRGESVGPRPLEFDARGFPIPQPVPGFMQRVGRLINGS
jgi:hypothetical protein